MLTQACIRAGLVTLICAAGAALHAADAPADLAALRRTAEAGDAKAQFALSERYRKAEGVEADQRAQLEWLTSAAKQGLPEAERTLANLYGELSLGDKVPNALRLYTEWMAKAARHGDLEAKLEMASMLHDGWDKAGIRQDKAAALALWREAAAMGSVFGEIQVGRCYENGDAVERDRAQAAAWYRKAIERDPVRGHSCLGRMLARSDAEADRVEAVACLRFSSDEHKEDWLRAMEVEEKLSPEARERALRRTREIKAEMAARAAAKEAGGRTSR